MYKTNKLWITTTKDSIDKLNDTTKQKISQSLRGRTKSATHTQAISNGLKKYWATVPNQPNNNENKNEEHE